MSNIERFHCIFEFVCLVTPELQKLGKEQEEQKKAVVVKFRKAIWDASYYISMDFALLSEEVQKLIGKGYCEYKSILVVINTPYL